MRISGTEPASVILCQKTVEKICPKSVKTNRFMLKRLPIDVKYLLNKHLYVKLFFNSFCISFLYCFIRLITQSIRRNCEQHYVCGRNIWLLRRRNQYTSKKLWRIQCILPTANTRMPSSLLFW